MNCSDYDELLIDRLAGSLDDEASARLDDHVATCGRCARAVRRDEFLVGGLEALRAELDAVRPILVFEPHEAVREHRPLAAADTGWKPVPHISAMPLLRVALAAAAVWGMVTVVWHRPTPIAHRPQTIQTASRSEGSASIATAYTAPVAPWLASGGEAASMALRGPVRVIVPARLTRSAPPIRRTPSILIPTRRHDDVDRKQDPVDVDRDEPIGAGPADRGQTRV